VKTTLAGARSRKLTLGRRDLLRPWADPCRGPEIGRLEVGADAVVVEAVGTVGVGGGSGFGAVTVGVVTDGKDGSVSATVGSSPPRA
jgi:hypothetical protein